VNLNGRPISTASIATADGGYHLALPDSFEGGVLTMELRTTDAPLVQGVMISAPLPKSNWTVLAGDWSIWLPARFGAAGEGVNVSRHYFDWRQRLLGPLDRFGGGQDAVPPTMQVNSAPLNTIGWRSVQTTFSIVPPEPIEIVDHDRMIAASFCTLLLAVLATSLFKIRAEPWILLASMVATMALLLPISTAPLAGGAFWGMLFGPLCRRVYLLRGAIKGEQF
jgi:hypothetical protein